MARSIFHLARWLAFQLGEHEHHDRERPASITVFTSSRPTRAES